jgi:hypothetical protein
LPGSIVVPVGDLLAATGRIHALVATVSLALTPAPLVAFAILAATAGVVFPLATPRTAVETVAIATPVAARKRRRGRHVADRSTTASRWTQRGAIAFAILTSAGDVHHDGATPQTQIL